MSTDTIITHDSPESQPALDSIGQLTRRQALALLATAPIALIPGVAGYPSPESITGNTDPLDLDNPRDFVQFILICSAQARAEFLRFERTALAWLDGAASTAEFEAAIDRIGGGANGNIGLFFAARLMGIDAIWATRELRRAAKGGAV